MGYELARTAMQRGAEVILVSGPTGLTPPGGVAVIHVQTTLQMRDAITNAIRGADALIMAAAPADYRPATRADNKIKKGAKTLTLELVENPDILREIKGDNSDFVRVGFAAESDNLVENAKDKLKKKRLDLIVANDITATDSGFGTDTNRVVLIDRSGAVESLPLLSKSEVAHKIMDKVVELLGKEDLRITLENAHIKYHYIGIPAKSKGSFPAFGKAIDLQTNIGVIETTVGRCSNSIELRKGLIKWYRAHPELKSGDKLSIEVIKPMKSYRLQIV
jgi:hypothetical protein